MRPGNFPLLKLIPLLGISGVFEIPGAQLQAFLGVLFALQQFLGKFCGFLVGP